MNISVVLPIKIPDPWQQSLAEFAIETMRMRTKQKFELVIAEADTTVFKDLADKHVKCKDGNFVMDFNAGVRMATGDYIVHTAIDIIVGESWLEALLEPFEKIDDCGVSTLSCTEPGAVVGTKEPYPVISEGMYGPIMMFPKGWELDEAYTSLHSDSDLIMRIYEAGKRSYRNHRTVCHHLDGITWKATHDPEEIQRAQKEADALFRSRYQNSPLWMAKMILRGGLMYGREHEL